MPDTAHAHNYKLARALKRNVIPNLPLGNATVAPDEAGGENTYCQKGTWEAREEQA